MPRICRAIDGFQRRAIDGFQCNAIDGFQCRALDGFQCLAIDGLLVQWSMLHLDTDIVYTVARVRVIKFARGKKKKVARAAHPKQP
jgi:hypothetical protein